MTPSQAETPPLLSPLTDEELDELRLAASIESSVTYPSLASARFVRTTLARALATIDHLKALTSAAPEATPQGWKMVPREPTTAMWNAGATVIAAGAWTTQKIYRAMYDASPPSPALAIDREKIVQIAEALLMTTGTMLSAKDIDALQTILAGLVGAASSPTITPACEHIIDPTRSGRFQVCRKCGDVFEVSPTPATKEVEEARVTAQRVIDTHLSHSGTTVKLARALLSATSPASPTEEMGDKA